MANNIFLILDTDVTFIDYQKAKILPKFTGELNNVIDYHSMTEETLFGEPKINVVTLTTKDDVKGLVEFFNTTPIESCVDSCLVICCSAPRQSTRKLEKLVKDAKGRVIVAKANSKDRTNPLVKILSNTALSRDVKDFIIDYSGTDYAIGITVVSTLDRLSASEQANVSIEDIKMRLALPRGAINPWELDKYIFDGKGSLSELVRDFRRICLHTHYLVVLSLLKNKFTKAYRINAVYDLIGFGVSRDKVAEFLGEQNNYVFSVHCSIARGHDSETLKRCCDAIALAERNMKSSFFETARSVKMEMLLLELYALMNM